MSKHLRPVAVACLLFLLAACLVSDRPSPQEVAPVPEPSLPTASPAPLPFGDIHWYTPP